MSFFMVKSLQQRLVFFLLLPAAIFLFIMGFAGFLYARKIMLSQWTEAAIVTLQRAAHNIDMRLAKTAYWIEMFHKTGGERVKTTYRIGFSINWKGSRVSPRFISSGWIKGLREA